MEYAITKMSSKGQIVIPEEMREGFSKGDKIILIRDGKRIVMRKAKDLDSKFVEDIDFAKRTEEAYKRYNLGEFKNMRMDDFIKEMKKW